MQQQSISLLCLVIWLLLASSRGLAQQLETPANSTCQGVLLHYQILTVSRIPPFLDDGAQQPYRFQSSLTLTNMGFNEVKNWQTSIAFQHREWLVTAPNTVLADGTQLPAPVGNATVLSGFPQTDLLNSVETAGDMTRTSVVVNMTGTEFGVNASGFPLPSSIGFPVDGYTCGSMTKVGSDMLQLCCSENKTAVNLTNVEPFLPPEQGDITIDYSVVQTFQDNYWAQVTISNDNPLGRIDGWNLTWEWKQGEFVSEMRGAQILDQDQIECLNGPAGTYYEKFDFSQAVSCKAKPTVVDLPIWMTNDTKVGFVPGCCRSGLLLPKIMDPSQSKSSFKLLVFKVPPHSDRDSLSPPANFDIGPRYSCGQPRLIAPVELPDPNTPARLLSAVKSWQVTCNLTDAPPRVGGLQPITRPASEKLTSCCVSFSAFYNTSAVPCPTCSCGCPSTPAKTCAANQQAMLLPSSGLLTAAVNRTPVIQEWARINGVRVPNPLPCPDTCGININWHVASDFDNGWSARISILNWGDTVPKYFAAVELDKAMPGFKELFTLNGTVLPDFNNTLYIQGKQGANDYLQAVGVKNNPGNLQATVTFDKKKTRGINVTGGDGFPTRVVFNGQECTLPLTIPSYAVPSLPSLLLVALLAIVSLFFVDLH